MSSKEKTTRSTLCGVGNRFHLPTREVDKGTLSRDRSKAKLPGSVSKEGRSEKTRDL